MSNDINNIFDDLTPLTKNNRYNKQESDLLFDPEKGSNGKFVVSESLYHRLDLNNHGFLAMTGRGKAFVGIVSNEDAVTYAGRPDAENKSDEFTSTELRDRLDDVGMTGDQFWFKFSGTRDDTDYYQVVDFDPSEEDEAENEDTVASEPSNDAAEPVNFG